MSFGYSNRVYRCPYFYWDRKNTKTGVYEIHCTGGSRVCFPDRKSFSDFADKYCGSFDSDKCPIAQMLTEVYERSE